MGIIGLMAKTANNQSKTYAINRRARFDYELHDEFVAGIVLKGHEAKAVRSGNADLKGSFVVHHNNALWLTNATIRKYKHASTISDYDPTASRQLLLTKREIQSLKSSLDAGFNIIPLKIFAAGKYIKLKIATARGKKKYDKRQAIKSRDANRDIARSHSRRR